MNLMCKLKTKEKSPTLKKLREQKEKYKIVTKQIRGATLKTPMIKYFLNCVPEIPEGRDVVARWSDYLVMYVNWQNDPDIKDVSQLKRQYGFVVRVENSVPRGLRKEKDPETYAMIFNNAERCKKHLDWFNACFHTADEQKEINADNEKKRKEIRKAHRERFTAYDPQYN